MVTCSPGSLVSRSVAASLTTTLHVKLVSVVRREERVRVEEPVKGDACWMVVRSPEITLLPSPSNQVKEYMYRYMLFPLCSRAELSDAEQVRVTLPTPPMKRGPGGAEIDTVGVETTIQSNMKITSIKICMAGNFSG